VDAYARTVAVLVDAARASGRDPSLVLFEVLSTCPYPLHRVMRRHGVGRFRVTQKADPRDPHDVYSTHRAERGDWVMLGNHDTPPIWLVVDGWSAATRAAWCDHLASRLGAGAVDRAAVFRDAAALAQPMLADLFASDAGRVSIFFADLFGERAIYNVPGVVRDDNWTLRVPPDFEAEHERRRIDGRALDVPAALATALRARGHAPLAERIDALAP
jgi:4-alpha-glucanotransferase